MNILTYKKEGDFMDVEADHVQNEAGSAVDNGENNSLAIPEFLVNKSDPFDSCIDFIKNEFLNIEFEQENNTASTTVAAANTMTIEADIKENVDVYDIAVRKAIAALEYLFGEVIENEKSRNKMRTWLMDATQQVSEKHLAEKILRRIFLFVVSPFSHSCQVDYFTSNDQQMQNQNNSVSYQKNGDAKEFHIFDSNYQVSRLWANMLNFYDCLVRVRNNDEEENDNALHAYRELVLSAFVSHIDDESGHGKGYTKDVLMYLSKNANSISNIYHCGLFQYFQIVLHLCFRLRKPEQGVEVLLKFMKFNVIDSPNSFKDDSVRSKVMSICLECLQGLLKQCQIPPIMKPSSTQLVSLYAQSSSAKSMVLDDNDAVGKNQNEEYKAQEQEGKDNQKDGKAESKPEAGESGAFEISSSSSSESDSSSDSSSGSGDDDNVHFKATDDDENEEDEEIPSETEENEFGHQMEQDKDDREDENDGDDDDDDEGDHRDHDLIVSSLNQMIHDNVIGGGLNLVDFNIDDSSSRLIGVSFDDNANEQRNKNQTSSNPSESAPTAQQLTGDSSPNRNKDILVSSLIRNALRGTSRVSSGSELDDEDDENESESGDDRIIHYQINRLIERNKLRNSSLDLDPTAASTSSWTLFSSNNHSGFSPTPPQQQQQQSASASNPKSSSSNKYSASQSDSQKSKAIKKAENEEGENQVKSDGNKVTAAMETMYRAKRALENNSMISFDGKTCSYCSTGSKFMDQHWYHCETCSLVGNKGCCSVCAVICHRDHKISYAGYASFFCDCGMESMKKTNDQKPEQSNDGNKKDGDKKWECQALHPCIPVTKVIKENDKESINMFTYSSFWTSSVIQISCQLSEYFSRNDISDILWQIYNWCWSVSFPAPIQSTVSDNLSTVDLFVNNPIRFVRSKNGAEPMIKSLVNGSYISKKGSSSEGSISIVEADERLKSFGIHKNVSATTSDGYIIIADGEQIKVMTISPYLPSNSNESVQDVESYPIDTYDVGFIVTSIIPCEKNDRIISICGVHRCSVIVLNLSGKVVHNCELGYLSDNSLSYRFDILKDGREKITSSSFEDIESDPLGQIYIAIVENMSGRFNNNEQPIIIRRIRWMPGSDRYLFIATMYEIHVVDIAKDTKEPVVKFKVFETVGIADFDIVESIPTDESSNSKSDFFLLVLLRSGQMLVHSPLDCDKISQSSQSEPNEKVLFMANTFAYPDAANVVNVMEKLGKVNENEFPDFGNDVKRAISLTVIDVENTKTMVVVRLSDETSYIMVLDLKQSLINSCDMINKESSKGLLFDSFSDLSLWRGSESKCAEHIIVIGKVHASFLPMNGTLYGAVAISRNYIHQAPTNIQHTISTIDVKQRGSLDDSQRVYNFCLWPPHWMFYDVRSGGDKHHIDISDISALFLEQIVWTYNALVEINRNGIMTVIHNTEAFEKIQNEFELEDKNIEPNHLCFEKCQIINKKSGLYQSLVSFSIHRHSPRNSMSKKVMEEHLKSLPIIMQQSPAPDVSSIAIDARTGASVQTSKPGESNKYQQKLVITPGWSGQLVMSVCVGCPKYLIVGMRVQVTKKNKGDKVFIAIKCKQSGTKREVIVSNDDVKVWTSILFTPYELIETVCTRYIELTLGYSPPSYQPSQSLISSTPSIDDVCVLDDIELYAIDMSSCKWQMFLSSIHNQYTWNDNSNNGEVSVSDKFLGLSFSCINATLINIQTRADKMKENAFMELKKQLSPEASAYLQNLAKSVLKSLYPFKRDYWKAKDIMRLDAISKWVDSDTLKKKNTSTFYRVCIIIGKIMIRRPYTLLQWCKQGKGERSAKLIRIFSDIFSDTTKHDSILQSLCCEFDKIVFPLVGVVSFDIIGSTSLSTESKNKLMESLGQLVLHPESVTVRSIASEMLIMMLKLGIRGVTSPFAISFDDLSKHHQSGNGTEIDKDNQLEQIQRSSSSLSATYKERAQKSAISSAPNEMAPRRTFQTSFAEGIASPLYAPSSPIYYSSFDANTDSLITYQRLQSVSDGDPMEEVKEEKAEQINTKDKDANEKKDFRCYHCADHPLKMERWSCESCEEFNSCSKCFFDPNTAKHEHHLICTPILSNEECLVMENINKLALVESIDDIIFQFPECECCGDRITKNEHYVTCKDCGNIKICMVCHATNAYNHNVTHKVDMLTFSIAKSNAMDLERSTSEYNNKIKAGDNNEFMQFILKYMFLEKEDDFKSKPTRYATISKLILLHLMNNVTDQNDTSESTKKSNEDYLEEFLVLQFRSLFSALNGSKEHMSSTNSELTRLTAEIISMFLNSFSVGVSKTSTTNEMTTRILEKVRESLKDVDSTFVLMETIKILSKKLNTHHEKQQESIYSLSASIITFVPDNQNWNPVSTLLSKGARHRKKQNGNQNKTGPSGSVRALPSKLSSTLERPVGSVNEKRKIHVGSFVPQKYFVRDNNITNSKEYRERCTSIDEEMESKMMQLETSGGVDVMSHNESTKLLCQLIELGSFWFPFMLLTTKETNIKGRTIVDLVHVYGILHNSETKKSMVKTLRNLHILLDSDLKLHVDDTMPSQPASVAWLHSSSVFTRELRKIQSVLFETSSKKEKRLTDVRSDVYECFDHLERDINREPLHWYNYCIEEKCNSNVDLVYFDQDPLHLLFDCLSKVLQMKLETPRVIISKIMSVILSGFSQIAKSAIKLEERIPQMAIELMLRNLSTDPEVEIRNACMEITSYIWRYGNENMRDSIASGLIKCMNTIQSKGSRSAQLVSLCSIVARSRNDVHDALLSELSQTLLYHMKCIMQNVDSCAYDVFMPLCGDVNVSDINEFQSSSYTSKANSDTTDNNGAAKVKESDISQKAKDASTQPSNKTISHSDNTSKSRNKGGKHEIRLSSLLFSPPCLTCGVPDIPFCTNQAKKLEESTKYFANSMLMLFKSSMEVQAFIADIFLSPHGFVDNKSTVSSVQVYTAAKRLSADEIGRYSNDPESESSPWKLVCNMPITKARCKIVAKLDYPEIVNCALFKFQLNDSSENLMDQIRCPRCGSNKSDIHGICEKCGENVFQCRECRTINYNDVRSFFCVECGYTRFGKFTFMVDSRLCYNCSSYSSKEEKSFMEASLGVYQQLSVSHSIVMDQLREAPIGALRFIHNRQGRHIGSGMMQSLMNLPVNSSSFSVSSLLSSGKVDTPPSLTSSKMRSSILSADASVWNMAGVKTIVSTQKSNENTFAMPLISSLNASVFDPIKTVFEFLTNPSAQETYAKLCMCVVTTNCLRKGLRLSESKQNNCLCCSNDVVYIGLTALAKVFSVQHPQQQQNQLQDEMEAQQQLKYLSDDFAIQMVNLILYHNDPTPSMNVIQSIMETISHLETIINGNGKEKSLSSHKAKKLSEAKTKKDMQPESKIPITTIKYEALKNIISQNEKAYDMVLDNLLKSLSNKYEYAHQSNISIAWIFIQLCKSLRNDKEHVLYAKSVASLLQIINTILSLPAEVISKNTIFSIVVPSLKVVRMYHLRLKELKDGPFDLRSAFFNKLHDNKNLMPISYNSSYDGYLTIKQRISQRKIHRFLRKSIKSYYNNRLFVPKKDAEDSKKKIKEDKKNNQQQPHQVNKGSILDVSWFPKAIFDPTSATLRTTATRLFIDVSMNEMDKIQAKTTSNNKDSEKEKEVDDLIIDDEMQEGFEIVMDDSHKNNDNDDDGMEIELDVATSTNPVDHASRMNHLETIDNAFKLLSIFVTKNGYEPDIEIGMEKSMHQRQERERKRIEFGVAKEILSSILDLIILKQHILNNQNRIEFDSTSWIALFGKDVVDPLIVTCKFLRDASYFLIVSRDLLEQEIIDTLEAMEVAIMVIEELLPTLLQELSKKEIKNKMEIIQRLLIESIIFTDSQSPDVVYSGFPAQELFNRMRQLHRQWFLENEADDHKDIVGNDEIKAHPLSSQEIVISKGSKTNSVMVLNSMVNSIISKEYKDASGIRESLFALFKSEQKLFYSCIIGAIASFYHDIFVPIVKQPSIQLVLIRASSQEEYFSRRLKRSNISTNDLNAQPNLSVPNSPSGVTMASQSGSHSIHGSLPAHLNITEDAGPTVQDLRTHIAKELGMDDAAEMLELLVGGKIVGMGLGLSEVFEKIWKPHILQKNGSIGRGGIQSLSSSSANLAGRRPRAHSSAPDELGRLLQFSDRQSSINSSASNENGSNTKIPPMQVIYRLRGVDGEPTEDFIEKLTKKSGSENQEEILEERYQITRLLFDSISFVEKRVNTMEVILEVFKMGIHILSSQNGIQGIGIHMDKAIESKMNFDIVVDDESIIEFIWSVVSHILVILECVLCVKDNRMKLLQFGAPRMLLGSMIMSLKIQHDTISLFSRIQHCLEQLMSKVDINVASGTNSASTSNMDVDSSIRYSQSSLIDESSLSAAAMVGNEEESTHLPLLLEQLDKNFTESRPISLSLGLSRLLPLVTYNRKEGIDLLLEELLKHIGKESLIKLEEKNRNSNESRRSMFYRECMLSVVEHLGVDNPISDSIRTASLNKLTPDIIMLVMENYKGSNWNEFIQMKWMIPSLRILKGLCRAHKETQMMLLEKEMVPLLLKLEEVPGNLVASVGEETDNVIDALTMRNDEIKGIVQKLRKEQREEKKKLAMKKRKKELAKVNISSTNSPASMEMDVSPTNIEGESNAAIASGDSREATPEKPKRESTTDLQDEEFRRVKKPRSNKKKQQQQNMEAEWLTELAKIEDEPGPICCVCSEGAKYKPDKVMGVYVYSRVIIYPKSLSNESTSGKIYAGNNHEAEFCGTTTISSFNCIHLECHESAVVADKNNSKAPKEEWEGAEIRNGHVKTNNLIPLRGGIEVSDSSYKSAIEKYFSSLEQLNRPRYESGRYMFPSRLSMVSHDIAILLLRFSYHESLVDETNGGGRESNMKLLVPLLSMLEYLLHHDSKQYDIYSFSSLASSVTSSQSNEIEVDFLQFISYHEHLLEQGTKKQKEISASLIKQVDHKVASDRDKSIDSSSQSDKPKLDVRFALVISLFLLGIDSEPKMDNWNSKKLIFLRAIMCYVNDVEKSKEGFISGSGAAMSQQQQIIADERNNRRRSKSVNIQGSSNASSSSLSTTTNTIDSSSSSIATMEQESPIIVQLTNKMLKIDETVIPRRIRVIETEFSNDMKAIMTFFFLVCTIRKEYFANSAATSSSANDKITLERSDQALVDKASKILTQYQNFDGTVKDFDTAMKQLEISEEDMVSILLSLDM